jgi:hypothetical protein
MVSGGCEQCQLPSKENGSCKMIQSAEIQSAKSQAALLSITSNTALIVIKLTVGIMMLIK